MTNERTAREDVIGMTAAMAHPATRHAASHSEPADDGDAGGSDKSHTRRRHAGAGPRLFGAFTPHSGAPGNVASLETGRDRRRHAVDPRPRTIVNSPDRAVRPRRPGHVAARLEPKERRGARDVVHRRELGPTRCRQVVPGEPRRHRACFDQVIDDTCDSRDAGPAIRPGQDALVGHSSRSAVGMLAAARHLELFHCYVGIGQIANMQAGETVPVRCSTPGCARGAPAGAPSASTFTISRSSCRGGTGVVVVVVMALTSLSVSGPGGVRPRAGHFIASDGTFASTDTVIAGVGWGEGGTRGQGVSVRRAAVRYWSALVLGRPRELRAASGAAVRPVLVTGAVAAVAYAGLQWLGRSYGSTRSERRRGLPGDDGCPTPHAVTTHAITIDAPPDAVWPWLVQMGWGRGQWYTARWVDRLLFPANGPSADRVIPQLQHLAVGDRILDGPPEAKCGFVVAAVESNRHLVLHSTEHLPPGWEEQFGASIDFTWAFVLDDLCDGRTRFLFRSRERLEPRWVRALYLASLVPADFVMARQMLRGVKRAPNVSDGP